MHFIQNDGGYYCYCQDNEKCKIFTIPIIFSGFEKGVENNIIYYKCLFWYYSKLCKELIQLFNDKKEYIECFQGEYKFGGRDWHTGEYRSLLLSESIRYNEKIQVDWLKREKLSIPPDTREKATFDLTYDEIS